MRSTSCTVPGLLEVESILQKLRSEGFSSEDISILSPQFDTQALEKFVPEKEGNVAEGVAAGAGAGGFLGGVLGWLVGIGSLAIPGVGPFIAAGPLMAVIGGTALGAAVGGVAGVFAGLGLPEYEAKVYEHKLKEGWTLISVRTQEEEIEKRERIKEIFVNAGAINVSDITFVVQNDLFNQHSKGELYARPQTSEGSGKQGAKTI